MKVEAVINQYQSQVPADPVRAARPVGKGGEDARADGTPPRKVDPPQPEQVAQAVKQINDYLQTVQRNLEFSIDRDTRQVVVKVLDAESGEVVRQIPPESVLKLAKAMKESKEEGLLFAQRA
ncbi:flagellar protein FlaG [Methylomarinovum tepidoasis]|uniref:Flagellar protein FlaG n=1 Tax=Methylomarinovum tepidoasis TaxID=2840183 RepID=A0AAU9CFS0_9GAMM|nr:flagellar protein FlaG [Methylomarinovum sp. IN45]BCX89078.1 flagellar protein FlaG [Methylomarinovum sp. IN45]